MSSLSVKIMQTFIPFLSSLLYSSLNLGKIGKQRCLQFVVTWQQNGNNMAIRIVLVKLSVVPEVTTCILQNIDLYCLPLNIVLIFVLSWNIISKHKHHKLYVKYNWNKSFLILILLNKISEVRRRHVHKQFPWNISRCWELFFVQCYGVQLKVNMSYFFSSNFHPFIWKIYNSGVWNSMTMFKIELHESRFDKYAVFIVYNFVLTYIRFIHFQ